MHLLLKRTDSFPHSTNLITSIWRNSLFPGPVDANNDYQEIDEDDEEFETLIILSDDKRKEKSSLSVGAVYLNAFRKENIALIFSYLCMGFGLKFISIPLSFYLIQTCNASSTQIGVLLTLKHLPFSFKIFYGLLSDSMPVLGYKRKPYLIIGWLGFTITNCVLAAMKTPSIDASILGNFIMTCFIILADVATDTMCVERSRLEKDINRGTFQALGYSFRALGMFIGAVFGSISYNKTSESLTISQVFLINGIFPLVFLLPSCFSVIEITIGGNNVSRPNLCTQMANLWSMLKLNAVWIPVLYIFFYNSMQIPNQAWNNFLLDGLQFTVFDIGLISIFAALAGWLGILFYKEFFFHTNWRYIFIATSLLSSFFSMLQLILIYRINEIWGMSDLWFAVGEEASIHIFFAIQTMPVCIMFVCMCPAGSEGVAFALLTTASNLGTTMAGNLGSWLTEIWDVSNSTFISGNFEGLSKLNILVSILQITPIVFIGLLPKSKESQCKKQENSKSNVIGAGALLCLVLASLIFSVGINIYLLVH